MPDDQGNASVPPGDGAAGGSGAAGFERILNTVGDGVYQFDPDGRIVAVNDAAADVSGYDRGELLGEHVSLLLPEADVERAEAAIAELLEGPSSTVKTLELDVRTAGGETVPTEFRLDLMEADGQAVGTVGVARDVGERRAREREFTDRILEAVPVGVGVVDPDGTFARLNERGQERLGVERGEGLPVDDRERYDGDGEPIPPSEWPYARVFETGEPVRDWHCRMEFPDGRRWLSFDAVPLRADDGAVEQVVVVSDDVTRLREQARRLERQRDELEGQLDEVFERVTDAFFALDEEWRFTHLNEYAAEMVDRTVGDLRGRRIWEAFPEAADGVARGRFEEAMATQEAVSFEVRIDRFDLWAEVHAYPSETGLSVYLRDVTDRVQRERRLERYETIVETVDDGVYVVDRDARFTYVNRAYADLVGRDREELLGSPASLVVDEPVVEAARERSQELFDGDAETAKLEAELRTAGGDRVPAETTFSLLPSEDGDHEHVGVVRDVGERKRVEETLRALYDSSRELFRGGSPADVDGVVVDAATDVLDLSGVAVYRYDDDRDVLVPAAEAVEGGFMRADGLPAVPPDDSSLTGHVYAVGESRRLDDVHDSPYLQAEGTEMRAGVFAPMGDHGVLVVGSRTVGAFDDRTARLVELLAANAEAAYDRVERERALAESERRYRTLVENVPKGAVALFDRDLRYVTVGGEAVERLGYTSSELEEEPVGSNMPADVADEVVPHYRAAIDGGEREFDLEMDGRTYQFRTLPVRDGDGTVRAGMMVSQDVTDRVERERRLDRQSERLLALISVNEVVRDINEALAEQPTRGEVERVVCDRLAASGSYESAWVGEVESGRQSVTVSTATGVDGTFDDCAVSTDATEPSGRSPTARAARSQEMQVVRADDRADGSGADPDGGSTAAIPITFEGTLYGVLTVSTDRPDAFRGEERRVVGQLGRTIGHAINAIERKRALVSDEVIEVELSVQNLLGSLGIDDAAGGTVSFDRTIRVDDGCYLVYGTVTAEAVDPLRTLAERVPHWKELSLIGEESAEPRFELQLVDPPAITVITAEGGRFHGATIEDGAYSMTVHLPRDADVRSVVDSIREAYPETELIAQRRTTRPGGSAHDVRRVFEEELTRRQRNVVEAAYFAGFFEWPRDSAGEDVADSLGIASSTFHQHLRAGKRKLLSALVDDTDGEE